MEAVLEFEKPIATLEKKIRDLRDLGTSGAVDFKSEIATLEKKLSALIDETFQGLSPWQRVQLSRHPNRPYALDYINLMFDDVTEIHGDRFFGEDAALVTGLATLGGKSVAFAGIQKGRNTKEKITRNFGMARPEGYRKAQRLMRLAGQHGIPIVTFIDTPGAYPGIDAEERGQAEAIARSLLESFDIPSPIVACIIGEGGSGGALAIAVADAILMQEYSTYSVISPESCASILWSDSSRFETAAGIMRMTPEQIKPLGIIDGIVKEPRGGAHRDHAAAAKALKAALTKELTRLTKVPQKKLIDARKKKFRTMGTMTLEEIDPNLLAEGSAGTAGRETGAS